MFDSTLGIAGRRLSYVLVLALVAGCAGQAENAADEQPAALVNRGALVAPAERHDGSPPLALLPPAEHQGSPVEHEVKPLPRKYKNAVEHDPVLQQAQVASPLAPVVGVNFDGIGQGIGGFTVNSAPPDTNGDVGPNHYVALVNSDFAVFSKTGALLFGPVATNTLWSGFGGGCQTNNDGDGIVLYDPIADRWIISQFSVSTTPFLQCVAVSKTPDPTGAYWRYSFSYTDFPDYPKFGVWPDAYYVTFNMFNAAGTAFLGAKVCAYDRAKMLTGAAATQQCFQTSTSFGGLLPADLDGSTLPPAGSPNYVVALGAAANQLAFWKFHVDWTTPANSTFTGPTTLATAAYSEACNGGTCIPQSGTTVKLDSLADRMMFRLAYRNFGNHESLVVNHSITAGSSTGIRWYELRSPATTPVIYQSGTWAPDSNYRWMGSAAMDGAGNIALGYSVSSSSVKPSIRFTGRLAGDALGTMTQGESVAIAGTGSQTGNLHRWGDYSMMAVDPVDDCTFWYTDEYLKANGSFNWSTRINSFKLPGCPATPPDFGIGSSPGTIDIQQGNSGTSSITTTQIGGSGTVALSASVSPSDPGVTASLSAASVSSGGSVTLTVSTTSSAPVQTYTVTVTGTEGSSTHSTSVTVNVNAPPPADFGISANPASLSIFQGSAATSTIGTSQVGSPGTVGLSASVSPAAAGVTASLAASSVAAGSGTTLTVFADGTAFGAYTVTVTGTEGSFTHSTSVTVSVSAPAPADFSISANPASLSIVQGNSGASAISTAQVGSAGTVNLSVSVDPADSGVIASLADAAVAAGGGTTLTVTVDGVAPAGSYTVTVTGVEGAATHSASVAVTVTAPPPADFSISAAPASLSVAQGASGGGTVSTAQVGSAGTMSLSADVPAGSGLTASLGATSLSAGGSTSISVTAAASAPTGTYTVTITGIEGSFTHTATIAVTVTAVGCTTTTQLFGNPGFESGTAPWTATAGVLGQSGGIAAHSGVGKAWLDGYGVAHTDDLYQTVTIPAGACSATLSFWLQIRSSETTTVTPFDTLTVTVRNTGGTVLQTLATYSNLNKGTTWVQKSFDVTAFKGQTVRLQFHGVEDSSLATSFFIDDTALNVVQ